jgi:3-methylcrotonyl-CoA carboxylase beta subunit
MIPEECLGHSGNAPQPLRSEEDLYEIVDTDGRRGYDARELLNCIIDRDTLNEYKAEYGTSVVAAYAKIHNIPVGILANQRLQTANGYGEIQIGGVMYPECADKAARFVMDCNQMKIPLLFFQDVMGFMVGKEAEQAGIIRSGAKLVNAVSNSIVPKITIIVGNSFGAGNYALCGKAYDPNFILAWPNAKYAVMGADQAADTLFTIQKRASERKGEESDATQQNEMHAAIKKRYLKQMDVRYGAARGWVDAIIPPHKTRETLSLLLTLVLRAPERERVFHTGVMQV